MVQEFILLTMLNTRFSMCIQSLANKDRDNYSFVSLLSAILRLSVEEGTKYPQIGRTVNLTTQSRMASTISSTTTTNSIRASS